MSALPYLKFARPMLDEATIAGVGDVLRSGHIGSVISQNCCHCVAPSSSAAS